jgi:hypothetical protein
MNSFIPVETEVGNTKGQLYIEVIPTEGSTGIKQRSKDSAADKLTQAEFNQMIRQAVIPACQTFVEIWQELNQPMTAESAEVEFNLGFTASGSAVIVQASGQASFKVKINWKFEDKSALKLPAIENINNVVPTNIRIALQDLKNTFERTNIELQSAQKALPNLKSVVFNVEEAVLNSSDESMPSTLKKSIKAVKDIVESVGATNPPPPPPILSEDSFREVDRLVIAVNTIFDNES